MGAIATIVVLSSGLGHPISVIDTLVVLSPRLISPQSINATLVVLLFGQRHCTLMILSSSLRHMQRHCYFGTCSFVRCAPLLLR